MPRRGGPPFGALCKLPGGYRHLESSFCKTMGSSSPVHCSPVRRPRFFRDPFGLGNESLLSNILEDLASVK